MIQYTYIGTYVHALYGHVYISVLKGMCVSNNSLFGILVTWLTSVVGPCISTQSHPCVVLNIPMYIHMYVYVRTYVCMLSIVLYMSAHYEHM